MDGTAIIVSLIFSCLVGLLGKKRKIGFGWSLVLSIFLSPIIGLIITLCSKKVQPEFTDVNRNKEEE